MRIGRRYFSRREQSSGHQSRGVQRTVYGKARCRAQRHKRGTFNKTVEKVTDF